MKIYLALMLMIITGSVSAGDNLASYRLPVTRDGKTESRLSYSFWSGEYPTPIIDLKSKTKGETVVSAYATLRDLKQTKKCTIRNGLYHPWSKTENSVRTYYTIIDIVEYQAIREVPQAATVGNDTKDIEAGAKVTDLIYLAEGQCKAVIVQGKSRVDIELLCDTLTSSADFKRISPEDKFSEQWIYLSCKEGYAAFIQDKALLSFPGAVEGEVVGYGEVGPKIR